MLPRMTAPPHDAPGRILARGICRLLAGHGFAPVPEFVLDAGPGPGLRADVIALGPKGEVWLVECKSGPADFRADRKWQGYLDWCDRFFWAVDGAFPLDLLPPDTGLIRADFYGGEILRPAPERRLAAARRQALARRIARTAALRLQMLTDPAAGRG